jgi:hypothetical protein
MSASAPVFALERVGAALAASAALAVEEVSRAVVGVGTEGLLLMKGQSG